jgi:transposase
MIVLGADMHKSSHTIAAIAAATGEVLDDKTAVVGARGFDQMVRWARGLGRDRVWALEDCRHVSGYFERFLIARGERVVRVPTRLMANSRRSSRERGKSDLIDAIAVARVVDARLPADQPDRLQQVKPTARAGVMSVAVSEAIIVKAAMSSAPRSAQTLGTRFGMRDVAAGRR